MKNKSLDQIQNEIDDWTDQFGNNESHNQDFNSNKEWLKNATTYLSSLITEHEKSEGRIRNWNYWSPARLLPLVEEAIINVGLPIQDLASFLGMVEEVGEIAGAMVKRHQGRGFQNKEEYDQHIEDGLADLLVFTLDYSNRNNVPLLTTLNRVWDKVQNRSQETWNEDKVKEDDPTNKHLEPSTPYEEVGPYCTPQPEDWEKYKDKIEGSLKENLDKIEQTGQGWEEPRYEYEEEPPEGKYSEVAGKYLNPVQGVELLEHFKKVLENLRTDIPSVRKVIYQEVAMLGLQYGDQPQTNIEEGIISRLADLVERSVGLMPFYRDAERIVEDYNKVAELNPSLMKKLNRIHQPVEEEYKEKFHAETSQESENQQGELSQEVEERKDPKENTEEE